MIRYVDLNVLSSRRNVYERQDATAARQETRRATATIHFGSGRFRNINYDCNNNVFIIFFSFRQNLFSSADAHGELL